MFSRKTIDLPRQARDKRRKSGGKRAFCVGAEYAARNRNATVRYSRAAGGAGGAGAVPAALLCGARLRHVWFERERERCVLRRSRLPRLHALQRARGLDGRRAVEGGGSSALPRQPSLALSWLAGEKMVFFRHLYIKTLLLPRHAQDKHRESTQKKTPTPRGTRTCSRKRGCSCRCANPKG
jgi:hypothetical protein